MKFCLKHHWGRGKASVGFELDWIRTLVSMATDSSHSYNGKMRHYIFLNVFDRIPIKLAGYDNMHKSLDEFEILPDSTTDYEVSCP